MHSHCNKPAIIIKTGQIKADSVDAFDFVTRQIQVHFPSLLQVALLSLKAHVMSRHSFWNSLHRTSKFNVEFVGVVEFVRFVELSVLSTLTNLRSYFFALRIKEASAL